MSKLTDEIHHAEEVVDEVIHASNEYEREPAPKKALKGQGSFWGMYAGEHTAGTEFMIGPLFVAWGVSAGDLILGLLLGNLAAVLSWRYLTATIATRTRITLYYKLEKICGRKLVSIYNLSNGVLFCFLAGAMITVSATAVGVPFPQFQMPTFSDTMPTGIPWCITVLIIGTVMTIVAAKGYSVVSHFSKLAAPWMFLIFLACGIVIMGRLGSADLIELLTPPEGTEEKVGFWGVFFFAWFCNAAMHVGMADMSVLRYAKKPSAGWASAAGMYLGHCIAWICAALLLIYWVREKGATASEGVAPGPMAYDAIGWAGLICVVIAGWTTANPTIYRAGLAFQGLFPKMSCTQATLLAGVICTIAGLFPLFAMKLLGFVGIYGTILAPVGAIIAVDVFWSKKLGITSDYAAKVKSSFNMAAFLSWLIPVGIGAYFYKVHEIFPSYLTLPVWISAGILYVVFSKMLNKPTPEESV